MERVAGTHILGDKSGHRNKLSEQGTLTAWRAQREGQVRIQKQTEQAGGHSLSGESRQGGKSGYRTKKKGGERRALTY
jgi:hypothetical protein